MVSCDICDFCLYYAIPLFTSLIVVFVTYFLNKIGFFYTLTHKVDETSTRHGGELVAEVLKAHGIEFIFTLVGGHISPILVSSEKKGIRVIDVRHEATSVFAADAVARLSGKVGVAAVTAGPGLTNTVTAIKNAQMAESPILLIGGAAAGILKGRGALQDIDQMVLFKPLCKFTATIRTCREIIPTLRKALQAAQSGVPGPVFVEFPIDTLYPIKIVKKEIGAKDGDASGFIGKIISWYLRNYMRNIFAGAWEYCDTKPLPITIPKPTRDQLENAANIIKKAKKPVILLGSQSTLPPIPVEELRKCLEDLGIPCFLGGMSRGLLGRNSPIHIRQQRREALAEADVVILAGAVADFRLSYGRVLKRRCKIIAINRSKEQLLKNSDMFWKPTLAVVSDVATFLIGLKQPLANCYKADVNWAKFLKNRDTEKESANEKKGLEETNVHLNPINILYKIEHLLPDNVILVADGGDFVGTAAYILRPRGPLTWLDPGAFGTLGVGGGFALGAKLVKPDCEVWIIYGDGSLGYSVAEMDTYTRFKLPVICLVGNDACWSQIAREQVPMFESDVACKLAYSPYELVAQGYGGRGEKINRENVEQFEEIVRRAQQYAKNGESVLLNVLIGKTNFREGSISV